ncbi:MAG: NAD(P)-dependent oxidoreductase, partial [Pseudomonadales bacterium]|nr:NAD(P)-dependent oxidoreductase [Pseudomonadales bacterium]
MRCLVTGATGFLGQHLCRRLLQEEAVEVRATGRKQSLGFTDQRLAYVACDLEQVDHCANALFDGVDTVFYLAG